MCSDLPRDVKACIRDITRAAERAASLTTQLLAFGRKQVLEARDVDLNAVVADTINMLERIVGEDVSLLFEPSATPTPAKDGDLDQLAQVYLTLP